jgi:hypothetical protein
MDPEVERELIGAFNDGWCGRYTPPDGRSTLERLRTEWAQATDAEREFFKAEIL